MSSVSTLILPSSTYVTFALLSLEMRAMDVHQSHLDQSSVSRRLNSCMNIVEHELAIVCWKPKWMLPENVTMIDVNTSRHSDWRILCRRCDSTPLCFSRIYIAVTVRLRHRARFITPLCSARVDNYAFRQKLAITCSSQGQTCACMLAIACACVVFVLSLPFCTRKLL